jgi:hypothetical protein
MKLRYQVIVFVTYFVLLTALIGCAVRSNISAADEDNAGTLPRTVIVNLAK